MKAAIPVQYNSEDKLQIADGFMEAELYCIYNIDLQTYELKETVAFTKKPGNLSLALKHQGIRCLLVSNIEVPQLALFTESGYDVFKTNNNNLDQNLHLFENGRLKKLTIQMALGISACLQTACSSCSSCN